MAAAAAAAMVMWTTLKKMMMVVMVVVVTHRCFQGNGVSLLAADGNTDGVLSPLPPRALQSLNPFNSGLLSQRCSHVSLHDSHASHLQARCAIAPQTKPPAVVMLLL
jgi:hypothetical protein